ncbi:hypothetical protein [Inquilinus sp. CAU 1745]|uniref:hypothetical protein n=1 Tax=Inquilinus sp. CAU 1745 TaxID=3140369 RepID=UPI00325BEB3B
MGDRNLIDDIVVDVIDTGSFAAPEAMPHPGPAPEAEPFVSPEIWSLSLEDLLPDEGREVVLSPPENASIEVASSAPVLGTGVADAHVTASGIDVEGFHFVRFESGMTLYYEGDLTVTPI